MALGALAVGITAGGIAGCSDDGGNTIVLGSSSIPVVTGLSTHAAMTDGQTPAGTAIRLQILGDDFDKNAEVRLLAKAPATLSSTAANLNSGVAGVNSEAFVRIPTANLQWQSQNRIDIITLPSSPLAAANLQGTVVVRVVNPGEVLSTDGTADGSSTSDELTYYADTGVQVAVAQAGPLAGAWTNIFPGQSGVEFEATITNMTLEPINTVALANRSLDFGGAGPHVLNYVFKEPAATLAVGASTTARFLAAFSNELPASAVSATCNVTAIGASSGRSYTSAGSVALTAGSTPTINVRGGNNQSDASNGGAGGTIAISSYDTEAANTTNTNGLGGLTIGAGDNVSALADQAGGSATDSGLPAGQTRANLLTDNVTWAASGTPLAPIVIAGAVGTPPTNVIEITAATDRTWTFTGNAPVVFKNVIIRFANNVAPSDLNIVGDGHVQFINCTIDLTDRRINATGGLAASGSLNIEGGNATADRVIDIQGCTFRTNGVRGAAAGAINGTAAGNIVIQAWQAASDGTNIVITNSTLDARGASMVNTPGLPGGGNATTAGGNVAIRTYGNPTTADTTGQILIDRQTLINASGGDATAYSGSTGGDAGTVSIASGINDADNNPFGGGAQTIVVTRTRDVRLDGRIVARGGDSLDAAAGTGAGSAVAAPGGGVSIVGRKVNLGNADGRPVLLANGGSSSIVGGLSLVANTTPGFKAATGGAAGSIRIGVSDTDGENPIRGPISIAAGSGLIAIGGGGDSGGGAGGFVRVEISRNGPVTNRGIAQTVTMTGVIDASGGWARVTGTGGNAQAGAAATTQAVTLLGNTDVTFAQGAVILAQGGSAARSANSASPVGDGVSGGVGGTVRVEAGRNNVNAAANGGEDIGTLTMSGTIGTRGGYYTLNGALAGAGGTGGNVTLVGEGVRLQASAKVVTNGGSCGDTGARNGGRAGAISVISGFQNQGYLGATPVQSGPASGGTNGDTDLVMVAGSVLQADGGNFEKAESSKSTGTFTVDGQNTNTVSVHWPNHRAESGDLVTVTGGPGGAAVSRVAISIVDANSFTYPSAALTRSGPATVTLFRDFQGVGGSNTITLRQDNLQLENLNTARRDAISVAGHVLARAGKTNLASSNPLTQPGKILISGSQVDTGTATENIGAAITIAQTAVVTAGGNNAATTNNVADQSLAVLTEDVGVITIDGKLTVDNDRPGAGSSAQGRMLVRVTNNGVETPEGRIVINSTAELLMSGGYPGGDLDDAGTEGHDAIVIENQTQGASTGTNYAISLAGTIRNEDQTVDAAATNNVLTPAFERSGHGGVILITSFGRIRHAAGEITARGTASAAGHGGQVTFNFTGNLAGTGDFLDLSGSGVCRVDGGGPNGWGGRIAILATAAGTGTTPRIQIGGTYTLSANGSGLGGGGLPQGSSLRKTTPAVAMDAGGIYISTVNNQAVTVGTSTTITATGGDNSGGTRNANGTPAGGCLGGVVTIGAAGGAGPLVINSSINVSGGANGAGPGGSGGQITVNCGGNGAVATANFGSGTGSSAVVWTADGGATSFPQSIGGVGGNVVVIVPNQAGTINFGAATPGRFTANARGGAGTTVGGNGGLFDVDATSVANTVGITFGFTGTTANVAVTGGTGSIAGNDGVARLRKTTGGAPLGGVGGATPTLVVEPAASLLVAQ